MGLYWESYWLVEILKIVAMALVGCLQAAEQYNCWWDDLEKKFQPKQFDGLASVWVGRERLFASMKDLVVSQCWAISFCWMRHGAADSNLGRAMAVLQLLLRFAHPGMNDHWFVLDFWRWHCLAGHCHLLWKYMVTLEPWVTKGCILLMGIDLLDSILVNSSTNICW